MKYWDFFGPIIQYVSMSAVICPLCGQRKARRACPALGQQICAVCCGTKRLTADPVSQRLRLSRGRARASGRSHRPAAATRCRTAPPVRSRLQSAAVAALCDDAHLPGPLPASGTPAAVIDDDVVEAAAALAATFETASRGVIYEHRPTSPPAERLAAALKPLLNEAGQHGGTAFERDAAVVMRRVEEAVGALRALAPDNRRAFLELLGRTMRRSRPAEDEKAAAPDPPRLILP